MSVVFEIICSLAPHCWSADDRRAPTKMVAQCPGPYETAQGVTHTTPEIFGSGGYVLQIAAAGAKARAATRVRPGLDMSQPQNSSPAVRTTGSLIHSSVPTVAVSNTSLDDRLNYSLSIRVWPPQEARSQGTGCGWSAEDTLGAVFNLPVMELLSLSKPPGPSGTTTSAAASATQPEPEPPASCTSPAAQRGLTRTLSSFHPDGGVYLSAPLLMMPPSFLAGRDTGFYLRLHLKLEAA